MRGVTVALGLDERHIVVCWRVRRCCGGILGDALIDPMAGRALVDALIICHIAANATSAGDYMALVQSQSSDHAAASQTAADHSSSTADYSHMMTDASSPAAQGPQEPPSADHLFADAHVDAGAAHDAGVGMDPGAGVHADAAAISPAAEPPPAAPEEQGHGAGH